MSDKMTMTSISYEALYHQKAAEVERLRAERDDLATKNAALNAELRELRIRTGVNHVDKF